MSGQTLAFLVAVAACVVGGALGGQALAWPEAFLEARGLAPGADRRKARVAVRALGGGLIAAHAGVALGLGFDPYLGGCMSACAGLAWLGAAAGRMLAGALEHPKPAAASALTLELLMAVSLLLPGAALLG